MCTSFPNFIPELIGSYGQSLLTFGNAIIIWEPKVSVGARPLVAFWAPVLIFHGCSEPLVSARHLEKSSVQNKSSGYGDL